MQDVQILMQALPYFREHRGRTFVLKFGGALVEDRDDSLVENRDIRFLERLKSLGPRAETVKSSVRRARQERARLEKQKEMKRLIDDFGDSLRREPGVGLFYYSGHGAEVKGVNYLIPVDAKIDPSKPVDVRERQLEYDGIRLGRVSSKFSAMRNPLNLMIIDACRDGFGSDSSKSMMSSGLAPMTAPSGTLIRMITG